MAQGPCSPLGVGFRCGTGDVAGEDPQAGWVKAANALATWFYHVSTLVYTWAMGISRNRSQYRSPLKGCFPFAPAHGGSPPLLLLSAAGPISDIPTAVIEMPCKCKQGQMSRICAQWTCWERANK